MAGLTPKDSASLERYRDVVGGAWEVLLGRQRGASLELEADEGSETQVPGAVVTSLALRSRDNGSVIPLWLILPEPKDAPRDLKAGRMTAEPLPPKLVSALAEIGLR